MCICAHIQKTKENSNVRNLRMRLPASSLTSPDPRALTFQVVYAYLKTHIKLGRVVCHLNSSTQEAETSESVVSLFIQEFQVSGGSTK